MHFRNKICFYENEIGFVTYALGGFWALRCLLASGVAHQCRTNLHAGLFSVDVLFSLADTLANAGVARWAFPLGL